MFLKIMIKNLLKLEIRDMGEAAEVINHRIKNYVLLVIPSLRLVNEYIKQYKNISAKTVVRQVSDTN